MPGWLDRESRFADAIFVSKESTFVHIRLVNPFLAVTSLSDLLKHRRARRGIIDQLPLRRFGQEVSQNLTGVNPSIIDDQKTPEFQFWSGVIPIYIWGRKPVAPVDHHHVEHRQTELWQCVLGTIHDERNILGIHAADAAVRGDPFYLRTVRVIAIWRVCFIAKRTVEAPLPVSSVWEC